MHESRLRYEARARALAVFDALGLKTVPLVPRGKKPLRKGFLHPTPEIWHGIDWRANLGVVMGEVSGDAVGLDFDSLDLPKRILGLEPRELKRHTPVWRSRRGWHVVFTHDEPVSCVPEPGFSVQGNGNILVAPPSIHQTGFQYEFLAEPTRIARLRDYVDPAIIWKPPEPTASDNTLRNTNPGAGARGASATTRTAAPREARERPRCWARADAWINEQSPRMRTHWDMLQATAGEDMDRSVADYALCVCLSEGDFTQEDALELLLWLPGSKAAERGVRYARRTVERGFGRILNARA